MGGGWDFSFINNMLMRVVPALICVTLHELAHGFVAYKMGDDTAKNAGRLTLNPIRHIDIMGLIMMISLGFGWAKAVPVNMYNFDNPKKGMAITALAGPLMNVLIAAAAMVIYGFTAGLFYTQAFAYHICNFCANTAYLSCAFAAFNILPIPPLDGSKVLFSLLPDDRYEQLMYYERYGMIALMIIVVTGVLDKPLYFLTSGLFDILTNIATGIINILV